MDLWKEEVPKRARDVGQAAAMAQELLATQRVHIHYYYGIRSQKDHPYYGFWGPNSTIVVYMDPLG